jgi:sugar lactone lactonase YvrE
LVQNGTNGFLYLSNIAINDGGNYIVVVTNNYGSVTSQVATLAVAVPPTANISGNQVVDAGSNAAFSVTASGTGPFYYIWCLNGTNLPKPGMIIAGGGTFGKLGDGGQATNASLANPSAATADAEGNIFITDMFNNRIRKVATNGIITTVAGNGVGSPSVNGQTATNTGLSHPTFALVDPAGDLFIAEQDANWITEVATNGILTHVAGYGGIFFGGDGGQATNASLNGPCGIALDAFGNLFVADTGHNRVRKVSTNGIITTIAGGSTRGFSGDGGFATNASLNGPNAIFPDRWGNLFIADTLNNRIRKVASNGIITTIAGSGTAGFSGDGDLATNASLCSPSGLTFDTVGNLLIADTCNERIRQVDPNGIITTIAGFSFTSGYLGNPSSVAVDARDNILIADTSYGLIIELPAWAPSFVISNVGVANGGSYTVIVNSPYGSVTSTIAALTVIVPPRSFAGSIDAGTGVQLQFSGTPNFPYTLQASTNLTPPVNWQSLITKPTDTNGVWMFIDTNELSFPAYFYRVVAQ